MADPTTAQAQTTFLNVVASAWDFLQTQGPAVITNINDFNSGFAGDRRGAFDDKIQAVRGSLVTTFQNHQAWLGEALFDLSRSASIRSPYAAEPFGAQNMVFLREYYDDVGRFSGGSVDSKFPTRGWTRASAPSGQTWKHYRLTVDEYGQGIETGAPQKVEVRCITGPGRKTKTLQFTGQNTGQDVFDRKGGGSPFTLDLFDESNITSLLNNPFFDNSAADAATISNTSVSGWTLTGTWVQDKTNLFRTGLNQVLKTSVASTATQRLTISEARRRTPHIFGVWVNKTVGTFTGTVQIDWGSKSQSWADAAIGAEWQFLAIDMDKDLYPNNWDETDASFLLTVTPTAGYLLVSGIVARPMVNNTLVGGWDEGVSGTADTTENEIATYEDTLVAAGKANHVLAELNPGNRECYLTTVGTNTIANPS